ncbi:MAG: alpha/beta hydrolase [Lachnospiraceae bacterium]|nr:alpha/beta hydrolase [Lachnospiraceae bacterium]
MANTSDLYDPLLPYLKDYYVIVCELDGHSEKEPGTFVSVRDAAQKIEKYVRDNLDGRLFGLLGFSLGGTIATELISRGNIEIERTILDAAFVIRMGIMTYPFKLLFQVTIWLIEHDVHIPDAVVESIMGKGNAGIVDTLYKGVTIKSIGNAALSTYKYDIRDELRNYKNRVVFWRGENEPYPEKSARLLKKYLPQMRVRVFKGMGHGQMLHEHTKTYAKRLLAFLEEER